ncbi:hypothetical protein [Sorangium sp. So ce1389]
MTAQELFQADCLPARRQPARAAAAGLVVGRGAAGLLLTRGDNA